MIRRKPKENTEVKTAQSVSNPASVVFAVIDAIMIIAIIATLFEISYKVEYGTGKPSVISVCDAWTTAKLREIDEGADFDTTYQEEVTKHLQNAAEMVEGGAIWE